MSSDRSLEGITLKVGPLGEHDRLLTFLSNQEGITRLAVPGARRPKSSLAAAVPFTVLELNVVGRRGLPKVRHIKILRSFTQIGSQLESLSAAQALSEITLQLVPINDPLDGVLNTLLIHLDRLETINNEIVPNHLISLACTVQACVHLLALGGYGLPLEICCLSGRPLVAPIGEWQWRCSLLAEEGFAIGSFPHSVMELNPSELALLQRLIRPSIPFSKDGKLMGPKVVWIKLLAIIEYWINSHLLYKVKSLVMLRDIMGGED